MGFDIIRMTVDCFDGYILTPPSIVICTKTYDKAISFLDDVIFESIKDTITDDLENDEYTRIKVNVDFFNNDIIQQVSVRYNRLSYGNGHVDKFYINKHGDYIFID